MDDDDDDDGGDGDDDDFHSWNNIQTAQTTHFPLQPLEHNITYTQSEHWTFVIRPNGIYATKQFDAKTKICSMCFDVDVRLFACLPV